MDEVGRLWTPRAPECRAEVGHFVITGDGRGWVRGSRHTGTTLLDAVTLLPTPTARDGKGQSLPSRQGGKALPDVQLLPTPRVTADRSSRAALTARGHWSAPSLGQALELAQGILPREYESWEEVQGWHGVLTPPPSPGGDTSLDDRLPPPPTPPGG